jgi:receptor expression-enhancing protein 5/6
MTIELLNKKLDQLGLGKYYRLPLMAKIGEKVGYQPSVVFLVLTIVSFIVLLLTGLLGFMLNLITFFFPAYSTFKAFENDDTKRHQRMLIFWVQFGLLHFLDYFLFFIPVYGFIRNLVTMYLYMGDYKGSEFLYHYVL